MLLGVVGDLTLSIVYVLNRYAASPFAAAHLPLPASPYQTHSPAQFGLSLSPRLGERRLHRQRCKFVNRSDLEKFE